MILKYIKNKGKFTLEKFRNFAYDSSYLHSKSFAWKRYYLISQKLEMPHRDSRVAEKDHYVRRRPNNNKKVDEVQQARKRRKEKATSIVYFFNEASVAELVEEI